MLTFLISLPDLHQFMCFSLCKEFPLTMNSGAIPFEDGTAVHSSLNLILLSAILNFFRAFVFSRYFKIGFGQVNFSG